MIETKFKLWRSASAAAMAGLSLAACAPGGEAGGEHGGEGGESAAHGEAGEAAPPPPPAGEGGEAAIGESGGEQGEAGVQAAYAGVDGSERTALRLQHLKGFVLAAQRVASAGQPAEASILVSQGLLEVYDPVPAEFGAFNPAAARDAATTEGAPALAAALASIDQAQAPLRSDPADLAARMADMASGLYAHVITPDGVDPVEYQHSFGMALAARDALAKGQSQLRSENAAHYREAMAEMDRLVALWPAATAPETPASYQTVLRQASRVRLALSPFL